MPPPMPAGSDDFHLRIHEIFASIQGEGVNTGMPTVFVRTQGCSHDCKWCDTTDARDPEGGKEMTFNAILSEVRAYPGVARVCLTGGEPLEQPNAKMFIQLLLNEGYRVDLETNGSKYLGDIPTHRYLTLSMDVKTPGSGMKELTRLDNITHLGEKDQIKFVIADDGDLEYAAKVVRRHKPTCAIILTPEGGTDLEPLIDKVMKDAGWREWSVRVLPQLHRVVWGERKGV
jgi:7-carboxy-7-deazaguanine synthase